MIAARGTVFAASCRGGARVTDLADGTTRVVAHVRAVAGRFAASLDGYDTTLLVTDWRTGAVVSRLDFVAARERVLNLVVDEDGTAAWERGGTIFRLPPGAPTPDVVGQGTGVELVGGVLAVRAGARFTVGTRTLERPASLSGWAFDGARLAWVEQPCAQQVVQVWDLAADPPAPADGPCATARVGAVSFDANARARLTCPRSAPAAGCAGTITATLHAKGRRLTRTQPRGYSVPRGTSAGVILVPNHSLRTRPTTARVTIGERPAVRRKVRTR